MVSMTWSAPAFSRMLPAISRSRSTSAVGQGGKRLHAQSGIARKRDPDRQRPGAHPFEDRERCRRP